MLVNVFAVVFLLGAIYTGFKFILIPTSKFIWSMFVNSLKDGYQQYTTFTEQHLHTFMQLDMAFYLFVGVSIYLLPTIISFIRKHPKKISIGFTNIFFGWSVIGWILALIWSLSSTKPPDIY
jgi:hypothetical protein